MPKEQRGNKEAKKPRSAYAGAHSGGELAPPRRAEPGPAG